MTLNEGEHTISSENLLDMEAKNKLNVIDEQGYIIGEETREIIHKKGLLHREAHVWFFTPKGEIIFQHRSKNAETYPDLLDATVGGHVEIGMEYESTALQEMEEETGIRTPKDAMLFNQMVRSKTYDTATGMTNNVLRAIYAYRYDGKLENLRVEKDEAIGFEAWPLEKIFNIPARERNQFIPATLEKEGQEIFKKIQQLLPKHS